MAEKKPKKFINRFLGMWTARASDEIPDGYSANSRNCDHSDPASLQPVQGYSVYGNEGTASNESILSTFKYVKLDGSTTVKLRVRDDETNSNLEWLNTVDTGNSEDGEWETLLPTLTTGARMSFWEIPTVSQDQLAMGNGEDNFLYWKGAFGSIASNTATVITLNEASATGAGFTSGGGVFIADGTEYAYSSATGKTLVGTGFPTFTANTGVAEAVDDSTYSTNPKTNVGVVAMSRLWLASGIRLYYSAVADGTDIGDTGAGNADNEGYHDVIGGEGKITALGTKDGWVIPMKENFIEQYRIDVNTASAGTTTYKYPNRKTIGRGEGIGAVNQQALTEVNGNLYYLTANGGIKVLSTGSYQDTFNINDITDIIRPTIEDGVFTTACMVYFDNKKVILGSYRSSSDVTANDKTIAIWLRREDTGLQANSISILDWLANDFMVDGNKLLMASAYDNNVYECFDGWSAVGAPQTIIYSFKRYHFDEPFKEKILVGGYLPIEGMIGAGTDIKFELDFDEGGSRKHVEAYFKATDTGYIIEQDVNTIGAFALGSEPIGGTMEGTEDLSFFRVFFTVFETAFYNIQLTVSCDSNGGRFKITKVGMDAEDAETAVPAYIKKSFSI